MKKYNDILADERPEFKAANYGFDALSNTELLSMVINRGAGTAESLSQARQLMNMADNNLSNLAKLSMDEMQVVQGIGDCKALAVLAALELGKRRAVEKLGSKPDMPMAFRTTIIIGAMARIGIVCEVMIHGIRLLSSVRE